MDRHALTRSNWRCYQDYVYEGVAPQVIAEEQIVPAILVGLAGVEVIDSNPEANTSSQGGRSSDSFRKYRGLKLF